jgi:hypothetical protein
LNENIWIVDHERVVKAQDFIAETVQCLIPKFVSFRLDVSGVHIPVNLNDHFQFIAIEVHNEVVNWDLPPKFQPERAPVTQQMPGVPFGNGLLLSQFSRSFFVRARKSGFVAHETLSRPPAAVALSQGERGARVRPNLALVTEYGHADKPRRPHAA